MMGILQSGEPGHATCGLAISSSGDPFVGIVTALAYAPGANASICRRRKVIGNETILDSNSVRS